MKILPVHKKCAIVLLAMAAVVPASAQYNNQQQQPPMGANGITLNAQLVKTGLYLFSSEGSNTLLRLSANGLILVDGQPLAAYDMLRARVRKISDQPVRALILTNSYQSHIGTNAKFLEAGARLIAQQNAKQNLASDSPPGGAVAPPTMTYDKEYLLRLGGVEAQLFHFGNAHTNGDTVVYFPHQKVVAVGDLFASTPNPDFSDGGSMVGWGPVLAQILKLDFDVVVPGRGPMVTRPELEAFKTKIDTVVSRATELVKKGVPKDQLMSQLKTDDLGWYLSFTGDQLDGFYAELSGAK
jgi:cyclase